MRNLWKRSLASILLLGTAGGAALGLAAGGDPPSLPVLPPVNEPAAAPAATDTTSQQPSLSLEWAGPPVVKVNQANEYSLFVRNTCGQPLQKVVVQVKVPENVAVQNTAPVSKIVEGIHLFEIGTLPSKASQTIKFQLKQASKGELNCQAWVTFTGTSAMKALVKEPKLAVNIKAPEKVILGDKFTVEYTVENVGDFAADDVRLKLDRLTNEGQPQTLKPGESRRLSAEFLATEPASVSYEALATASEGLSANAKTTVQVMVPKLDVSVAGPSEVMIGRKAAYLVKVGNCGDVPLTGVIVRESLPAGFRVLGGEAGPDGLQWAVGDLAVGAVKELKFEGTPMQPGSLAFHATAEGSRGTKAMKSIQTAVDGIPALRMEMLDSVDPVEKGGETTYEIRVVNTGSKADANIFIRCELPMQFTFVSATGPTKGLERVGGLNGNDEDPRKQRAVVFDPIAELAPKTEAVFKIKVKAAGTGDARFKATLTSKHLTSSVTKEESTRIYGE